jgi:polygalacturonase
LPRPAGAAARGPSFDVRAYGAKGDGVALDTGAVNRAIAAAAAAGGGAVDFPAGTYRCFSIRLRSHVVLDLEPGSTILAARPAPGVGAYDAPLPNPWDLYQDFGHSHWRDALIWGEGLTDVGIVGTGRIDGLGLTRFGPGPRRPPRPGDLPLSLGTGKTAGFAEFPAGMRMIGQGDKAIALKECRNVTLRDFTVFRGGHFALLATGVDNLTIDDLRVDTNRDGFDLDCCRNVVVAGCRVNSPNDDAICLKSSYALGRIQPTENVLITGCVVSGYDLGTMLSGADRTTQREAPDHGGVTGRIKFGTESDGGLRNVALSDCVFEHCRGFALESVDGGAIDGVTVANLVMRGLTSAPIFIRLGDRGRGPPGTKVGSIRRVIISHIVVEGADPRYASSITGIPGHPVEDVSLSDLRIRTDGGGTAEDAAREPPDQPGAYPEPSMFGVLPAYGLYARHVRGLSVDDLRLSCRREDRRPPIRLEDVAGADFSDVRAQRAPGVPLAVLRGVTGFSASDCPGAPR